MYFPYTLPLPRAFKDRCRKLYSLMPPWARMATRWAAAQLANRHIATADAEHRPVGSHLRNSRGGGSSSASYDTTSLAFIS